MKKLLTTRELAKIGVMAALLSVAAPFSLYVGVVPVSLATLVVYLVSAVVSPKCSVTAVFVYIVLGAIGLPVFAGFNGGFQVITGVTGGFLVGYLPMSAIVSFTSRYAKRKKQELLLTAGGMLAGSAICYTLGTGWFMLMTEQSLAASLSVCVIPFLIGDGLKIILAAVAALPMGKALEKLESKR